MQSSKASRLRLTLMWKISTLYRSEYLRLSPMDTGSRISDHEVLDYLFQSNGPEAQVLIESEHQNPTLDQWYFMAASSNAWNRIVVVRTTLGWTQISKPSDRSKNEGFLKLGLQPNHLLLQIIQNNMLCWSRILFQLRYLVSYLFNLFRFILLMRF